MIASPSEPAPAARAAPPRLAEAPPPRAARQRVPRRERDPRRRRGPGPAAAARRLRAVAAALAAGTPRRPHRRPPARARRRSRSRSRRAAVTSGRSTGAVLLTPGERWSSGDALGRRARHDGTPATTGQVPDAASRGKWLVLDELDRARADPALGGLSTFLGGLPVTLPGGEEVKPPEDWRDRRHGRPARWTPRRRSCAASPTSSCRSRATTTSPRCSTAPRAATRPPPAPPAGCSPCASCARSAPACSSTPRRTPPSATPSSPADERTLAREAYSAYVEPLIGRARRPRPRTGSRSCWARCRG